MTHQLGRLRSYLAKNPRANIPIQVIYRLLATSAPLRQAGNDTSHIQAENASCSSGLPAPRSAAGEEKASPVAVLLVLHPLHPLLQLPPGCPGGQSPWASLASPHKAALRTRNSHEP